MTFERREKRDKFFSGSHWFSWNVLSPSKHWLELLNDTHKRTFQENLRQINRCGPLWKQLFNWFVGKVSVFQVSKHIKKTIPNVRVIHIWYWIGILWFSHFDGNSLYNSLAKKSELWPAFFVWFARCHFFSFDMHTEAKNVRDGRLKCCKKTVVKAF